MVEMVKTRINGTWDIILPKHRADRAEWYSKKGWEKERLFSMEANLNNHDTLFYIGAEEGDMAALCAGWVGDIVLFEPNDRVWPNIKAIWEANNLPTPYTFSGFASNKNKNRHANGMNMEHKFPASADGEVIGDHGFKELHDNQNIPEITIDYATQFTFTPTAISIDVEGSEWQVLRGAEETLKKYHPKIWLSLHPEFMFHIYGEYSRDLRNWLIDKFGYKERLLAYDHEVHLYYS